MKKSIAQEIYNSIKNKILSETNGTLIPENVFVERYLPLVESCIDNKKTTKTNTHIIGIQGPPGIGKTILATTIKIFLRELNYEVESFSIDDFYMSNEYRIALSKKLKDNPFYQIARGMPGTHRIILLYNTLKKSKEGKSFSIPQFDKSLSSRKGDITNKTVTVDKPLDFVIFEGWFLYMQRVKKETFLSIVKKNGYAYKTLNNIDPKQKHFETVLKMSEKYQKIWEFIDSKILLSAEDITNIEKWRVEKEKKQKQSSKNKFRMEDVRFFAKNFVPFSYFIYETAMKKNDISIVKIGENHLPISVSIIS